MAERVERIVTKDELKKLILDEQIQPEDLYDEAALQDWAHRKDIEKRLAEEKALAARDKLDPDRKYLDPEQNPFIKPGV